MKNLITKVFALLMAFSLLNCGKTTPAPVVIIPVSELIKKTWIPQTVQENGDRKSVV